MKRFAFLGAGNMAAAIIGGMKNADITVYDKFPSQYDKFDASVKKAPTAAKAVEGTDYIVLSVKPQNFPELLAELRESGTPTDGKVFISIAAGISCESICRGLGKNVAVIRTMPNTPLMIGKGVTALSRNELVSDDDFCTVEAMFASLGKTMILPEDKMNAVIAATSSAPAYVYYFIDCIYREAKREGIDSNDLLSAICAMVSGSAEMLMSTGKTPEELIRMVTSPKGTTERAMNVLYQDNFSDIIARAMQACSERAEELSKQY
ncbi:MAG: pyrroline-5-carboxylate reductase [Clostridia bacterium]|nr:pyrroline-5-carboxylate reductase [Clostridia bacterium]